MDMDQRLHAVQHQHLRQFMVFVYKQNIVDGILLRLFSQNNFPSFQITRTNVISSMS
jgi:hypothetical protein